MRHLLAIAILAAAAPLLGTEASAQDLVTYRDHARRVLKKHCVSCHNTNRPRSDLDLSSYEGVLAGGASGEAVVAGDPEDSFLYLVAAHEEEPVMPPGDERMPDDDLLVLRRWIESGLPETIADAPPVAAKGMATVEPATVEPDADAAEAPADTATGPAQTERAEAEGVETAVAPAASRLAIGPVFRGRRAAPIIALDASPTTGVVAVGGQMQVLLFSAEEGDLLGVLPFPEGEPQRLRFSEDGARLIAGGGVHSEAGLVVVWDVASGQRVWQGGDEYDVVLAADLSPDARRVVLGGPERIVKVLSTHSGEPLHRLDKHTDWVLAASFSPDGHLFATADRDGGAYVWETESGEQLHSLRGHSGPVAGLSWQRGGDVCVTAGEDGEIRRWDMHTGKQLSRWRAHKEGVVAIDTAGGAGLASVGRDAAVRFWSNEGEALGEPIAIEALPTAFAMLGESECVVGAYDGALEVVRRGSSDRRPLVAPASLATTDLAVVAEAAIARSALPLAAEPLAVRETPVALAINSATGMAKVEDDRLADLAASLERRLLAAQATLPSLVEKAARLRAEIAARRTEGADAHAGAAEEGVAQAIAAVSAAETALAESDTRRAEAERLVAAMRSVVDSASRLESTTDARFAEPRVLLAVALERLERAAGQQAADRDACEASLAAARQDLESAKAAVAAETANAAPLEESLEALRREAQRLLADQHRNDGAVAARVDD